MGEPMYNYGKVARIAIILITKKDSSVLEAWHNAAHRVFPNSQSSRDKGCPRSAFLGLCSEGYVKGVPKGNYSRSTLNKDYAIKAVELLKVNPDLATNKNKLWSLVVGDDKSQNGQLDVVIDLWNDDKIQK